MGRRKINWYDEVHVTLNESGAEQVNSFCGYPHYEPGDVAKMPLYQAANILGPFMQGECFDFGCEEDFELEVAAPTDGEGG